MRSPRNKLTLPENWRDVVAPLNAPMTRGELSRNFGVSNIVTHRWQKDDHEFNVFCMHAVKVFKKREPQKSLINNMTPDEIDNLLFDLIGDPTAHNAKQARIAIRQLRKEKRELMSEVNRLKHAEHIRKTSRGLSIHANGGGSHETL